MLILESRWVLFANNLAETGVNAPVSRDSVEAILCAMRRDVALCASNKIAAPLYSWAPWFQHTLARQTFSAPPFHCAFSTYIAPDTTHSFPKAGVLQGAAPQLTAVGAA